MYPRDQLLLNRRGEMQHCEEGDSRTLKQAQEVGTAIKGRITTDQFPVLRNSGICFPTRRLLNSELLGWAGLVTDEQINSLDRSSTCRD